MELEELREDTLKEDGIYYAMEIMKLRANLLVSGQLNASKEGNNMLIEPLGTTQLIKDASAIYNYLNDFK